MVHIRRAENQEPTHEPTTELRPLGRLGLSVGSLAIRAGGGVTRWGIRRLQPDCPVRGALESLGPLFELAVSRNSTKQSATS